MESTGPGVGRRPFDVVLPGEGHVPVSRPYALEAIRRTQAWFDRLLRPSG